MSEDKDALIYLADMRIDQLETENAKLLESNKKWMGKAARFEEKNAKLRELVRGLVYATHPADRARLIADATELVVEVDDGSDLV